MEARRLVNGRERHRAWEHASTIERGGAIEHNMPNGLRRIPRCGPHCRGCELCGHRELSPILHWKVKVMVILGIMLSSLPISWVLITAFCMYLGLRG